MRPVSAMPEAEMMIIGSLRRFNAFDSSTDRTYVSILKSSAGCRACCDKPHRLHIKTFRMALEHAGGIDRQWTIHKDRYRRHIVPQTSSYSDVDQFLCSPNRKGRNNHLPTALERPCDNIMKFLKCLDRITMRLVSVCSFHQK